ncbi:hypothetical protein HQ545_06210 [Candidatus Woesearchaeota archaeon]|nr:hypothetical protein [Candidatus Woesearchaeota archaeon]
MRMNNSLGKKLVTFLQVCLIVFGIYISIQVLIKILGGSWETEALVLGMLFLNLSATSTLTIVLVQLRSDHKHHFCQFKSLAGDFKRLVRNVDSIRPK